MQLILKQILDGAVGATWPEQIATVLGLIGVWLALRESLWNFPVGLVQVAIFGWVCFRGRLYSDAVLQVVFGLALAYGWQHWLRGAEVDRPMPIQRLSRQASIGWIGGCLALWIVWGTGMHRYTDAVLPYGDGFVFASSVASQWLQARKALENWIGWIIANTVAIAVFWIKEFYWFSVLYFVFWLMAWWGLHTWWRSWKAENEGH
jgi:nicotinamide mononucleotide transporter